MGDFTTDDNEVTRRRCDSALGLVMPITAGGREKLNKALLSSDMEETLEAVCRSDALKDHLSSMKACKEFFPTTTTTTEATTTTVIVEPTAEASGLSDEHSEEQPGQDIKAKEVQALTSNSNLYISDILPLLLLMGLLLINFL